LPFCKHDQKFVGKFKGEQMRNSYKATRRDFIGGLSTAVAITSLGSTWSGFGEDKAGALIAKTKHGKIRGYRQGPVLTFLGIPYGAPTGGDARFMPSSAPAAWQDVKDCTKLGPCSPQTGGNIFHSAELGPYFTGGRPDGPDKTTEPKGEDCLCLNVLTPRLDGHLPVMVYIHGGGFSTGSGALTAISDRFVAEQNVVLVGVNDRLNVFGYTYLGGIDSRYADSGNVGLLDLVASLKWVRDNIGNFGGDPSNVTIFGESGGGAKVSTLLSMPSANGLFRRAIIESGSLRTVRTKEAAEQDTAKVLKVLGITPDRIGELSKMTSADLLAAASQGGLLGFGPVADGRSVPHQPWDPMAPPQAEGVSLLVGNCKDESTIFFLKPGEPSPVFHLDWGSLRSQEITAGIPADVADMLIDTYRGDYPSDSPSDIYFRIAADRGVRRNAIAQATLKVQQNSGDVYMYQFAWDTPVANGDARTFHTAELPLAMRLVLYPQSENLSRQISGAWAGFARNGNPNHPGMPTWDTYTLAHKATMVFDVGKTQLVIDPAKKEMSLLEPYPGGLL
jgi:para-nitrobenzyl esterase